LNVYWINLDSRKDRAFNCRLQLEGLHFSSFRVPAISRSQIGQLENVTNQKYFRGILACRMSHFKAMESFLNSAEDYCLILEDDFIFSSKVSKFNLTFIQNRMGLKNIGLLQIGHLPKGISFNSSSNKYLKLIFKVVESLRSSLETKAPDFTFVDGFLPGAHAYVVNREMAKLLLLKGQSNTNIPFDLWLNDIAKTQNMNSLGMKIYRLKHSMVMQNRLFESDLQS